MDKFSSIVLCLCLFYTCTPFYIGFVILHYAGTLFLKLANVAINHSFIHRSFAAVVSRMIGKTLDWGESQVDTNVLILQAMSSNRQDETFPAAPVLLGDTVSRKRFLVSKERARPEAGMPIAKKVVIVDFDGSVITVLVHIFVDILLTQTLGVVCVLNFVSDIFLADLITWALPYIATNSVFFM